MIPRSSGAPRTRPRSRSSTSSTSAARRSSSPTEPVAADGVRESSRAPPAGRRSAGLASLHVERAALRARRRATGDGGAHRRPRARRRHRAAGGAGRLDRRRPPHSDFDWDDRRRARPLHLHRDRTARARRRRGSRRARRSTAPRFNNQRVEIRYDHIPFQLLQPAATHESGGARAGDSRPPGRLPAGRGRRRGRQPAQMGYEVTTLTGADLTPDTLRGLRCGGHRHPRLQHADGSRRAPARRCSPMSKAGGTVIAQYNQPDGLDAELAGSRRSSCASRATASPTSTRR